MADIATFIRSEPDQALLALGSSHTGLNSSEAERRLAAHGPNVVQVGHGRGLVRRLFDNVRNPLVILLTVLACVSYATGDVRATVIIAVMVALGVVLRFAQELRSDKAAEKLQSMVAIKSRVRRDGHPLNLPSDQLVPGDVIELSAGDLVPADIRLLSAHDLHLNQSLLTGESMPVEKRATAESDDGDDLFGSPTLCFTGSNVQTGSAVGLVVATGANTYFGQLAREIGREREATSFELGINRFTWLMIQAMLLLVPLVFVLNGLSRGDWIEAVLFALAVAVGLTPEMLPMIVTVNLSKGAIAMSRKQVIVKRLNAIQNLGAMDLLCTDKTGTLTQGKIVLVRHADVEGNESEEILHYAFINSFFETGLKNVMDAAVLEHEHLEERLIIGEGYVKVDEIPFDFQRRRLSVVVDNGQGERTLICKGAVEEVIEHCSQIIVKGEELPLDASHHYPLSDELVRSLNEDGFRVVAVACRRMPNEARAYVVEDEAGMTLVGFLAFLDPPKETAQAALEALQRADVRVRILTGDNGVVTQTICRRVGLEVTGVVLGSTIASMSDDELATAVTSANVFAKLSPMDKERIIAALQSRGHVVGFIGDGINDAPALKRGDVGIAVDTAADVAKESSDIILLEQGLMVVHDGVLEGRRVFGNVVKYIKMAASSNVGNVFSVVGASIFLPFLPMLPIQILVNNLLYDFSQTSIPTDAVDQEWLKSPRAWSMPNIRRFILYIGPISSIFDYATFLIMLYLFDCWSNPELFHTGWFMESVFTQTLIIHVIRTNRVPFVQSRASTPLIVTSLLVITCAAWLPYSPLAPALGLVPLPGLYWILLLGMLCAYLMLTQVVKSWFVRKFEVFAGGAAGKPAGTGGGLIG